MFPLYQPPAQYTWELFGVEYLYVQSGLRLCPREDLDREIDEGFEDVEIDDTVQPLITDQMPEDPITVTTDLTDSGSEDEEEYVMS